MHQASERIRARAKHPHGPTGATRQPGQTMHTGTGTASGICHWQGLMMMPRDSIRTALQRPRRPRGRPSPLRQGHAAARDGHACCPAWSQTDQLLALMPDVWHPSHTVVPHASRPARPSTPIRPPIRPNQTRAAAAPAQTPWGLTCKLPQGLAWQPESHRDPGVGHQREQQASSPVRSGPGVEGPIRPWPVQAGRQGYGTCHGLEGEVGWGERNHSPAISRAASSAASRCLFGWAATQPPPPAAAS